MSLEQWAEISVQIQKNILFICLLTVVWSCLKRLNCCCVADLIECLVLLWVDLKTWKAWVEEPRSLPCPWISYLLNLSAKLTALFFCLFSFIHVTTQSRTFLDKWIWINSFGDGSFLWCMVLIWKSLLHASKSQHVFLSFFVNYCHWTILLRRLTFLNLSCLVFFVCFFNYSLQTAVINRQNFGTSALLVVGSPSRIQFFIFNE